MAVEPRLLLISPVRNEGAHIERVARAVAAQETPPRRWIVIDDQSNDDTLLTLRALEREIPFLRVASNPRPAPPARDRLAMAAAPRTFNAGLGLAPGTGFTHIMKLDGDIELPPTYLTSLFERFARNPMLGIAGCALVEPDRDGRERMIPIPPSHVHGAVKCYSAACFEAIGGVREQLGWDTIDEVYARMRGFDARTFHELVATHHRPIGSADGTLRGRARHGTCAWIVHQPPSWVALRSLKLARSRPVGLSGAAFLFGYARAAAHRVERVPDADFRSAVHRELRGRVRSAARVRWGARPGVVGATPSKGKVMT